MSRGSSTRLSPRISLDLPDAREIFPLLSTILVKPRMIALDRDHQRETHVIKSARLLCINARIRSSRSRNPPTLGFTRPCDRFLRLISWRHIINLRDRAQVTQSGYICCDKNEANIMFYQPQLQLFGSKFYFAGLLTAEAS